MSLLINGSICLTDILEQEKKGHSAFTRSKKNQKVYFNITQWVNEENDQHGNNVSYLLNSSKEKKEAEGKVYIGNGKKAKDNTSNNTITPIKTEQQKEFDVDDLPF